MKENLIQEVDKVLERTPLIIRPRKANIDDNDPAQELLPPPLMPQVSSQEEGYFAPYNMLEIRFLLILKV